MNILFRCSCALGLYIGVTWLSACEVAQPTVSTPGVAPQAASQPAHLDRTANNAPKPAAYTWSKWQDQFPNKLPTDLSYFVGTVPTLLVPINKPQYQQVGGPLYALVSQYDKQRDYALWEYFQQEGLPYYEPVGKNYFTGIVVDGSTAAYASLWGIPKSGEVFSTYQSTTKLFRHYFSPLTFTSVAVRDPAAQNPTGFLFATSKTKTYEGSSGPYGSAVMLFVPNPSKKWPAGTWKQMPFGAYQLSADPKSAVNIGDLDDDGNVWDIAATRNKSGKFIGYAVYALEDVVCSNSEPISFLQVAINNATFLGLDAFLVGSKQIRFAVWYYDAKGKCWNEVGAKSGFLTIAVDPFKYGALVWASDENGDIWFSH